MNRVFIDTNVLLYLLSADTTKADRAEEILEEGGVVSVQVLNEFVAVALRKLKLSLSEIREVLTTIRPRLEVVPLSVATHERALVLHERHRFSFYDCLIVATAEISGAERLLTEDLADGMRIGDLVIVNPFRA